MQIIYEQDEFIRDWLHDRLGYEISEGVTIALAREGHLEAVACFHEYRQEHGSIELTFATKSPKWQSRRYIRAIFGYAFGQLGCGRITTFAPAVNSMATRLNDRIGFVREGIMRKAFYGGDLVMFGMLRDECKWLRHGKKQAESTTAS